MDLDAISLCCGGVLWRGWGGGNSAATGPTQPIIDPNLTVPFQNALANIVNRGLGAPFVLTGTKDVSTAANPQPLVQITGSGTFQLGASTSVTFTAGPLQGQSAFKSLSVFSGNVIANGKSTPLASSETIYFRPSNYTYLAETRGQDFFVYDSYVVPSTVKAGDTGTFGQALNGPQNGILLSKIAQSYSVNQDASNSLLVTIFRDYYGALSSTPNEKQQSVYRIDTAGNVRPVSIKTQSLFLGSVYQSLTYTFN